MSASAPATTAGYGRVARGFHWLIAALLVIVVAFGWAAAAAPLSTPPRAPLLLLHRSIGLTILAAMVLRALWRWRHPPPPLPQAVGRAQRTLAGLTHFSLYLVLIAMPLAGYVNAAAADHPVSFFGIAAIPPLLPTDNRLSQIAIAIHLVGQYAVYAFVALHVTGALYHGVLRRDGVLDRMLPRRRAT
ncbi:MAG TPA: cytochrome b [Stellaceae bacterium]